MKYLLEPKNGKWVAAQNDLTSAEIKTKILAADVCISDLDDTDTDSPAKEIAKRAIGIEFDPLGYLTWGIGTTVSLIKNGKNGETERWRQYVHTFLKFPGSRAQVSALFNPEKVRNSLYPGVEEFYASIPAARFYLTRNIKEVADVYGNVLGFTGVISEAFYKEKAIQEFLINHSQFQRYVVRGDSDEDQMVLDVLRFQQRERKIESVTGIYHADSPSSRHLNSVFEINVGKDQRGLVGLLRLF